MRKFGLIASLFALMAVPAVVSANHLQPSDFKNAAKFCKAVREEVGSSTFKQTYGTNHNRSNAFGKCVSRQARVEDQNQSNAAKDCKAERALDPAAFDAKYGTNKNNKNAFGRCVSQKAKALSQDQEDATVNAAKTCRAERALDSDAFRNKYGTNHNKRNAFGKCVSKHAREQNQS